MKTRIAQEIFNIYLEMFVYYMGSSALGGYAASINEYRMSLPVYQQARALSGEAKNQLNRIRELWPEGKAIFADFDQMFYWQDRWIEHFRNYHEVQATANTQQGIFRELADFRETQLRIEAERKKYMEIADSKFFEDIPQEFSPGDFLGNMNNQLKTLMANQHVPLEFYKDFLSES